MNDLLEYGRPQALERQPEELPGMLAEASRACDYLARAKGARVELELRCELGALPVDRKRIVQVFQNLLENALHQSSPGGCVTVQLERGDDGSLARVAVRDRGPGFSACDLPHVFEPFFTRRKGGTGLGLSIVQRIVEQHGGLVEARNHPAGGAEVAVLLPLQAARSSAPSSRPTPQTPSCRPAGPRCARASRLSRRASRGSAAGSRAAGSRTPRGARRALSA